MIKPTFSERCVSSDIKDSVAVAKRVAATMFGCKFQTDTTNGVPTTKSRKNDGGSTTVGYGKGAYATVGSIGECIERTAYKASCEKNLELRTSEQVLSQSSRFQDVFLQYAMQGMGPSDRIPCVKLECISGHQEEYSIPRAYLNFRWISDLPREHSGIIRRYVSTNGVAFGLNESDSTLHALNEVIERDFISEFFMVLRDKELWTKNQIFEVDIHELENAEQFFGFENVGQVRVFQSRTIFGPFATIVLVHSASSRGFLAWGAGASLSQNLSLERALDECRQMISLRQARPLTAKLHDRLRLWRLQDHDKPAFSLREYACTQEPEPMSVDEQLQAITNYVNKAGFTAWKYTLASCDAFSVSFVHIPRAERYFMNSYGLFALPSQFIDKHLEDCSPIHSHASAWNERS